ncbi:unnamed protein product [Clonostachys rhizophaga]|uniref:Zn(2)-C6 fungal-type domain-containing protein n=1 Tax=Clonostachys rhizophaga TaxID=160324 RepID=A0A9N9VKV7_9HYPO|nr:unnamed protein product [Clonostachys rhizophaga]
MPGVAKSTACANCKRKRIKCDQKWPTCAPCRRSALVCPGPSSTLKFIQHLAPPADGTPAGKRKAPVSSKAAHPFAVMVDRGHLSPYNNGDALHGSFRLQVPRFKSTTTADRVTSQLVHLLEIKERTGLELPPYLKFVPERLSHSACLADSIALLYLTWQQASRGQSQAKVLESRIYGKALKSLQRAVNSQAVYTVETLAAMVILLGLTVHYKPFTLIDYRPHTVAIRHVMRQMGAPQIQSSLHIGLIQSTEGLIGGHFESPWRETNEILQSLSGDNERREGEKEVEAFARTLLEDIMTIFRPYLTNTLPTVLKIRKDPIAMRDSHESVLQDILDVRGLVEAARKDLWEVCSSPGFMAELPEPNFFLGHKVVFTSSTIANYVLSLTMINISVLAVLYDVQKLYGTVNEPARAEYQSLCLKMWKCLPYLETLDAATSTRLLKSVASVFEHATDEDISSILKTNLEWSNLGAKSKSDKEGFRAEVTRISNLWYSRGSGEQEVQYSIRPADKS